jgi:signal transduction histidine kinase
MNPDEHHFFSFFNSLNARSLREASEVGNVAAQTVIFEEGETSDCLYLVLSGTVQLCKRAERGSYITIAYAEENDFFGELGVLDGSPRSTRAVAAEDATLARIPRESVLAVLDKAPGRTGIEVFKRTIQHLRQTDDRYVAEVVRKEKMTLVGEMASTIIHDLKNPFQAVLMASQFIREKHADEKTRRWSKIIHDQIHMMVGMVEELLEFSRGTQNLSKKPVNLATLLEKFTFLHQDYLTQQKVQLEITPLEAVIAIDASKILRVLQNLVYNATQAFAGQGGHIFIVARLSGEDIEIEVRDDGPGIPDEIMDRLFEPFVTSGKKGGTGLGLAIARSIVEAHSGQISCESKQGEGTTFLVSLPCAQAFAADSFFRGFPTSGTQLLVKDVRPD